MPQAIVAAATFISAEIGEATLAVTGSLAAAGAVANVTFAAAEVAIYAGISYGTNLLFAPKIPEPGALQIPLKQSMPVRQSAFGRVRVSGAYALFGVGVGGNKTVSYDVLALLDGQSNQLVSYYLNDDLMALHGTFWYAPGALAKYGAGGGSPNLVQIDKRLGFATETAWPISTAVPGWTSDHRGDGVTNMIVICKEAHREDQPGCFPNGVPSPSAVLDSQLIFDPRDVDQTQGTRSTYSYTDNPPLALLAYLTDAAGGMELDYARFIAPTVDLWTTAADECDGLISTSGMHATLLDAAAAGDGAIFLADTTGLTAGVVIQLPTETVTVSSLGLAGEVDITGTLAFSHQVGELAYWDASGQSARYRCAGAYRHDNAPGDVMKAILGTFDGWMGQRGDGALVLRTNALYDPTVVLTDRHIVGYQVQHYLPDEQATNQFIVSYTDPASAFNKAEAGYVQDDIDIAARGQARSQELALDWVPSGPQAIAVARAILARSTQPLRGVMTCNLAGLAVMGERYVRLQISELPALNDIVVEVTGKIAIDLSAMTVNFPFVATGSRAFSSAAAIAFVVDVSGSVVSGLLARLKEGLTNALNLVGSMSGGGIDIAVVAFDTAATSIVKRAASASDIADIITWVNALMLAGAPNADAAAAMTEAKSFFDGTDGGISDRRIIFVWDGVSDTTSSFFTSVYIAYAAAAQAVLLSMTPPVASYVINVEFSDTTYAAYIDNTPDDGIPIAPDAESLTAYIEQALFGSTSTTGSGYTLPPLGPPSGGVLAPLDAPTISSVTPDYPDSGGGVSGARLLIDVEDEGDVTWKVRWKLSSDTSWTEAAVTDPTGSPPELLTSLIPASGTVDVQVAYVTARQVSPWSATSTTSVSAPVADQPFGFAFTRSIAAITPSTSIFDFATPEAWTLPAGLPDSQVDIVDDGATSAAAPSADTDFDVQVNGVSVGTATIASGALTGTFTKASDTASAVGEITSLIAPADLHGMAGRLIGAIKGVR